MATLKDVAEKTGISQAAASRILNRDPSFSATLDVRLAVFKAASELGYRTPRQKKDREGVFRVGIADWHVVPEYLEPCYAFLDGDSDGETEFVRLGRGEVESLDGIIALGVFSDSEIDALLLSTSNIVFINAEKTLDYTYNRIVIDFDLALTNAIDYLSMFTDRIAYIGGIYRENGVVIGSHREAKIRGYLMEKGLYDDSLFFSGSLKGEEGGAFVKEAVEKGAKALLVSSELIEESALREYGEEGLSIPIVIYRDIPLRTQDSRFPTIRMYSRTVWEIAWEVLYNSFKKPRKAVNTYVAAVFEENRIERRETK